MSNTEFDNFLRRQKDQAVANGKVDRGAILDEWQENIRSLHEQIEAHLKQYVASGDIAVDYEDVALAEELLGEYSARCMLLTIGAQTLTLRPVGTIVIGARGRVDLIGRQGVVKFVLVAKKATKPNIGFAAAVSEAPEKAAPPTSSRQWAWKIATPPPAIMYQELTTKSLMQAIMEVANG